MTPDEIITSIHTRNCEVLYAMKEYRNLTHEEVLALMDAAAMHGFKMGSNTALAMLQGALAIRLAQSAGISPDKAGT